MQRCYHIVLAKHYFFSARFQSELLCLVFATTAEYSYLTYEWSKVKKINEDFVKVTLWTEPSQW